MATAKQKKAWMTTPTPAQEELRKEAFRVYQRVNLVGAQFLQDHPEAGLDSEIFMRLAHQTEMARRAWLAFVDNGDEYE